MEEIQSLDDTEQLANSKHMLQQFNQMKKILVNFSFKDKGKAILSTEINWDVIGKTKHKSARAYYDEAYTCDGMIMLYIQIQST